MGEPLPYYYACHEIVGCGKGVRGLAALSFSRRSFIAMDPFRQHRGLRW